MASKSLQRKFILFILDAALITAALLIALKIIVRPEYFNDLLFIQTWFFALPIAANLIAVYLVQGYHLEEIVTPWRGLSAMTVAAATGAVATGFLFFLIPEAPEFSAKVAGIAAVLQGTSLWLLRLWYGRLLSRSHFKENLLLVGMSKSASKLAGILALQKRSPYRIIGVLVGDDSEQSEVRNKKLTRYQIADLPELLGLERIDAVVLGMSYQPDERLIRAVSALKRRGIKVRELSDLFEEVTGMLPVQYVGELKMLFQNFGQRSELGRVVERTINSALALIALAACLPLWPILIIGQQLSSRGAVFVERSDRVGLGGVPFRLYKFRSMVPNATALGMVTEQNDKRIFAFGKLLRKTHLDELPQLLNIIGGDMNFIGPRAEYVENVRELEKKIPYYHERHLIKPGVTGWAQVRNIYTSAAEKDTLEKIQYDLYYLKNRSIALDIAIVLRTLKLMVSGRGIA